MDEEGKGRTYADKEKKLSPAGEGAGAGGISYLLSLVIGTQLHLPSLGTSHVSARPLAHSGDAVFA